MEKKIGNLVFIFLLIQCSALFMVYRCFHTDGEAFGSFLIHTTLWHTLLLLFLILHKSEFANKSINTPAENIGEKLSLLPARINTANKITLCRISSVPLVAFLLKNHEIKGIKFVLTAVLVFVFLTDLFDGLIARKYNQETDIGRMLDSMSDYSLLTLVSVVYFQLGILPGWFFFLILSRLLFQAVGMMFFMLLKFPMETNSTRGGKITIAAAMILYTIELLRFFIPHLDNFKTVFMFLEYGCALIVFVFLFEKIHIFYCHYKKYRTHSGG